MTAALPKARKTPDPALLALARALAISAARADHAAAQAKAAGADKQADHAQPRRPR